jgi:hypothetical protein
MSRVIRRPRTVFAVLTVAVVILAGPAAASAARSESGELGVLFGLSTAPDGSILVADASQGIVQIKGDRSTLVASLPGAADVDAVGSGEYYAVTGGGHPDTGEATLYRVSNGHVRVIADLGAFEETVNPDAREINPNPFDVEVLNGGGVLVADAGGNDILYVDTKGRIEWVATLPEEVVPTANGQAILGCPDSLIPDLDFVCDIPAMPAQAVATSIAIGPDGAVYAGELKGLPAPLGESRIWRIEPGTLHARCGTPGETRCTVVGDGFTSIIDLQFGPDGTLYVTELDEGSWATLEFLGLPNGGTIDACKWGAFPFSCKEVAGGANLPFLPIPTATTIGGDGSLYTTTWSLVPGMANVIAVD